MQNEVSVSFVKFIISPDTRCQFNFILKFCFFFHFPTVSYLVVFHIFFFMFIWSYWKTIWSTPAGPSKAVGWIWVSITYDEMTFKMSISFVVGLNMYVQIYIIIKKIHSPSETQYNKALSTMYDAFTDSCLVLSVWSSPSREGTIWTRRTGWGAAGDFEEGGEDFTCLYTYSRRRWAQWHNDKINHGQFQV